MLNAKASEVLKATAANKGERPLKMSHSSLGMKPFGADILANAGARTKEHNVAQTNQETNNISLKKLKIMASTMPP